MWKHIATDTLFCLMYIVARLTDCAIDTSVRWTIS